MNGHFDLPPPYKATTFEVFVKYVYSSRIPHNSTWTIDDSIEAYKLGKFLEADRFVTLCDGHVRSQLFLKSPQLRLSHLSMLADLSDDPIHTLIQERIVWLIIEGTYEAAEDPSNVVHDLDAISQPVWKELLASIILQARKRSLSHPPVYGHSNRGPGSLAATSGSSQPPVGQGLFGNPNTAPPSGGPLDCGHGLFGIQQPASTSTNSAFGPKNNTGGGLFGNNGGGLFGNTGSGLLDNTGGSLFGNTGGGLFSSTNQQTSLCGLFGQPSTDAGNCSSVSAGTVGGLFGSQQPKNNSGGRLFGSAPQSNSIGSGLFGAPQVNQSSGSLFSRPQPVSNTNGSALPLRTEQESHNTVVYQSIAATPTYQHTSHEELRRHDYQGGRQARDVEKPNSQP